MKLSIYRYDSFTGDVNVLNIVFWSPDDRGGALPQRTQGEAGAWPANCGEVPLAYDNIVALQRL